MANKTKIRILLWTQENGRETWLQETKCVDASVIALKHS